LQTSLLNTSNDETSRERERENKRPERKMK